MHRRNGDAEENNFAENTDIKELLTISLADIPLPVYFEGKEIESQLYAIKDLISRNQREEKEALEYIKNLERDIGNYTGDDEEYTSTMEGHRADLLGYSIFRDAAHSMSTVGMLAPFIESLFVSIFSEIRKARTTINETSDTDIRRTLSADKYWDPHYEFTKKGPHKDLVKGILQLAESTGLSRHLPCDYREVLTLLFQYRNKMFHNGFEWPKEERDTFKQTIMNQHHQTWFESASKNGEPWIFYMSKTFTDHCIQTIDNILAGYRDYIRSPIK